MHFASLLDPREFAIYPRIDLTRLSIGTSTAHLTRRISTFVALLLLALWLPATLHGSLETAGILAPHTDCHHSGNCDSENQDANCHSESHGSIDEGSYKPSFANANVKAPAPILSVLTTLNDLTEITPQTIIVGMISPARTDAPPELAPTWQFITRAAPSPRAPGTLA